MKTSRTILALILSLALVFAAGAAAASADYDYAAHAKIINSDYSGKTVILHSNDVHGAIAGYACMTGMKTLFENAGAKVLMVDAGDFSQGTVYVSSTKGAAAVTMMDAAGYDIVTLGNHEFDFGYDQLMENLEQASFQVICADVYRNETGETIFPATAIVKIDKGAEESEDAEAGANVGSDASADSGAKADADSGAKADSVKDDGVLRIGFFGMDTPETETKVNPGLIRDVSFANFDDLYASAQLAVDSLQEQGADLVIGLVHLGVNAESGINGYRSLDLYENVSGIDFLIDGHSHTVMTSGENGEPIQSTGTKFAYVGVVVIDNETGTIEDHFLLSTEGLPRDEAVAEAAQDIIDEVDAEYSGVFARTEVLLNGERDPGNRTEQTNLGTLICDAMVWSVVSEGGIDDPDMPVAGILNGGSIRAAIEPGDISRREINNVLPFGNTLAVVYVTGAELLEALEASTFCTPAAVGGYPQTSGIEWVLDTTAEYDQGELYELDGRESTYYAPASIRRVSILSVNGEPFDEAATYAVVTNNFCAAGGDTYNVFHRAYSEGMGFDTGLFLDEVVMDYISDILLGVIGEEYAEPGSLASQIRD